MARKPQTVIVWGAAKVPCTCGGMNENCSKCSGLGFVDSTPDPANKSFGSGKKEKSGAKYSPLPAQVHKPVVSTVAATTLTERMVMRSASWGPEFTEQACLAALESAGLRAERLPDDQLCEKVAHELAG